MKRLIYILILFALYSCGNKKAQLVTLQKTIKDSLENLNRQYWARLHLRALKVEDSLRESAPDYIKFGLLKDAIAMDTLRYKMSDEMRLLSHKISAMENRYDSLEFEIKKY